MDGDQKMKRIARINEVFDKCVRGNSTASMAAFGVNNFPDLIGRKFYFFTNEYHILNNQQKDTGPEEAFLGQVAGVKFRFLTDLLSLDDKENLSKLPSICDLKVQTCFPFIQTTLGELSPPWGDGDWILTPRGEISWGGDVVFV